jgi:uncharacterized protein (TIRG00374 family)
VNVRVAGRLFRLLFAAGLTGYLLWRSDPSAVLAAAAQTDLSWVAVVIGLVLVDRTLMAYRWIVLLCVVDPADRPPVKRLLEIFFVSTFVGSFLPASIGGDAVRAYSVSRERVSGADAVASVFMDRMLGVASLLVMGVPGLLFARDLASNRLVWIGLVATGAACAITMVFIFSARAGMRMGQLVTALPIPFLHRMGPAIMTSIQRYSRFHRQLANVLASSIAVQVLRILQAYGLGRALGIPLGVGAYFAFIPVILLIMLLPITINGLGTSQAAFVWFFARAGIAYAPAFALSALFVGLQIVGNLPGAVLYAAEALSPGGRRAHQGLQQ